MWKEAFTALINIHAPAWAKTMKLCHNDDQFLGTEKNEFLSIWVNTAFTMKTAPQLHTSIATQLWHG